MVVYNLICEHQHRFEGWFVSGEDFATQHAMGNMDCPVCGSKSVQKMPNAARIKAGSDQDRAAHYAKELEELRRKVVDLIHKHTEDVGGKFTEAARRIHYREAPAKSIRGIATREQIAEMTEEGIEVFAIPVDTPAPDKLH